MKKKRKKELEFREALLLRKFEIDNFWKRCWFFGALLLAIISAYIKLSVCKNINIPIICISFFGFLVSLGQSLMNRGSKYWQERWEHLTKNRESALGIDLTKTRKFNNNERYYIDACIRAKGECSFTRGQRFSVSKIAILIWDLLTISMFFIWLNDLLVNQIASFFFKEFMLDHKVVIFHFCIIVYILLFAFYGKVFERLKKKEFKNPYSEDSENYILNKKNILKKDLNS